MSQLMQEVRKNLEDKPSWMGDDIWNDLKQYWKSSTFKKKNLKQVKEITILWLVHLFTLEDQSPIVYIGVKWY